MTDASDMAGEPATAADLLADAALEIAGTEGWRSVTLAGAAARAGIDPPTARRTLRCKAGLLAAISARVDAGMLAALDEDATDPAIPSPIGSRISSSSGR